MHNAPSTAVGGRRLLTWTRITLALVVVFVLVVAGLSLRLGGSNALARHGGGLQISAGPDAQVYVGDHLLGRGAVFLSWSRIFDELLDEGRLIEVPAEAPSPSQLTGSVPATSVLAWAPYAGTVSEPLDALFGPGAVPLESMTAGGTTLGVQGVCRMDALVVRRSDGRVDMVNLIELQVKEHSRAPTRRFWLPVRIVAGPSSAPTLVPLCSTRLSVRDIPFARAVHVECTPIRYNASDAVVDALRKGGIWTPPADSAPRDR